MEQIIEVDRNRSKMVYSKSKTIETLTSSQDGSVHEFSARNRRKTARFSICMCAHKIGYNTLTALVHSCVDCFLKTELPKFGKQKTIANAKTMRNYTI